MKEDYCTFFPDGSWSHCCKAHDKAYEMQGDKHTADIELYSCVKEASPSGLTWLVAVLMLAGVSLFGRKFYKK